MVENERSTYLTCCATRFNFSFTLLQWTAKKMRRLSNLLGCRDPEYTTPSNSRSKSISDPTASIEDDEEEEATSAARKEDEVWDDLTFLTCI